MKTKFKYLALMASVILLAGFSSCSNDDGPVPDEKTGGTKTVKFKISGGAPATYSESAVGTATAVTFTDGELFFADNAGNILGHYGITSGQTSGSNINLTQLTGAGVTLTDLSDDITKVYVVGNVPAGVTLGATNLIADVKSEALKVQTQVDFTDVTLYGENDLTNTGTTSASGNPIFEATVVLNPIVARIELADMTGIGSIISYEVEGIFVDNYYSEAALDGTVDAAKLVNNGAFAAKFNNEGETGSAYTATPSLLESVFDWYDPAKADVSLVAKPATGVWAYNVFAASGAGSAVPRLIIRLKNIAITGVNGDAPVADVKFVTISGFKDASTAAVLTSFEAGKIYKISAAKLEFDENDLSVTPNNALIDVNVDVKLADWTVVDVDPVI